MDKQAELRINDHMLHEPGRRSEDSFNDAQEDVRYKTVDFTRTLYDQQRVGEWNIAVPITPLSPWETASTSCGTICTSGAVTEPSGCGKLRDSYTIVIVIVGQCVHSKVVKANAPVLASAVRTGEATQTECNLPYRSAVPGKTWKKL